MRQFVAGALGAALILVFTCANALAQSTAGNVIPGYLATSGCPGSQTSCFIQYSPTNPVPVVPGSAAVWAPYQYTPVSPGQHNVTIASATPLTVPAGALFAEVCVTSKNANYTTDGTTMPTSSVGEPLTAGQCIWFSGRTILANFSTIQQASAATLDVEYFK